ncbi:MAG: HAMP domain-containing histidine kinase, partial [Amylibacter sp.]|nr:HAMP domain-containing histidine kinase [Amylibacter sp.]
MLVGLIWGIGAIKAASISYGAALFFSLALGGTALGAVSSQSVVMRSCLSSIWTSVSLLAFAHWFIIPDATGRFSAGLMILFGVTLTVLANRMNGFLIANHKLRQDLEKQVVELEHARRIASDANASKSRFMAHASHDLRQPLHAIGLLNNNLQHEKMSGFAQDTVKKIGTSVASMSELFRALLDFSALELGQIQMQKSRFDIVELLDEIVARNIEQAKRKQCELNVLAGPCWVETDRSLLTNIIQNLVSNAIKYAPGKPILLRTDMVDKTITVSVLDRGNGIPSAKIKAVFKEYYQMETHDGQTAGGLGLGLALVQKFSDLLGLECTMSSDSASGTKVQISGLKPVPPQA